MAVTPAPDHDARTPPDRAAEEAAMQAVDVDLHGMGLDHGGRDGLGAQDGHAGQRFGRIQARDARHQGAGALQGRSQEGDLIGASDRDVPREARGGDSRKKPLGGSARKLRLARARRRMVPLP